MFLTALNAKSTLTKIIIIFITVLLFTGCANPVNGKTGGNSDMNTQGEKKKDARAHLRKIMPSRQQVKDFIDGRTGGELNLSRNAGWTFDADLGWVHCDSVKGRSVDGSKGFYHYEADGARKVINFADKPSRIHTYGDSFTHCDQVSDTETWQEYLAGHLQEPIRNYGVGGYSVYQAYLRMLKVEKENPAEYIILNIYNDDHFRNLDPWRSIRFGRRTICGYTLPYLKVNVEKGTCQQVKNIFSKPEDVYKLCDEKFLWRTFEDDPVLQVRLASKSAGQVDSKTIEALAVGFGVPMEKIADIEKAEQIRKIHTEAALYATKNTITWTEQFVRKNNKKLMIILSFNRGNVLDELEGKPRFDQTFVDWLKDKPYPVIDMRDAFKADFKNSKLDAKTYLKSYYIGHHSPRGNFFTAWAIKNKVVEWLEPKPMPYK